MRLSVIHRNRIFCDCLASIIASAEGFQPQVIDSHNEGEIARSILHADSEDVFLVDANLSAVSTSELVARIRKEAESARVVIMLSSQDHHEELVKFVALGVHGCVLEDGSLEELQNGIEKVVKGESFYSPRIVELLFQRLANLSEAQVRQPSYPPGEYVDLTPREEEILALVELGLSNKQIARKLSLSIYTVKNHVHNVLEKLKVGDRFEAVNYARQRGWRFKV
jgi:DNA-binding NarL/FixJ family response regulator